MNVIFCFVLSINTILNKFAKICKEYFICFAKSVVELHMFTVRF